MVASADRDSLTGHPGYRGSYWAALTSALSGKASYADSIWMRNISTEVLLVERIRRRDTSNIASALQALASGNQDATVARRTHLRQVFFSECIRGDHVAALVLNQMLQTAAPRSQEALYAKMLLRLHLDSLDREALAKQSAEDRAKAPHERPVATGIVIEGPWPVPQRTEVFLRIRSEEAVVVDRSVYDLRGALMRRDPGIPLRSGWNDMTLRLDGFAPGTYMLVIEDHGTRHAVRLTVVGER